MTVEPPARSRVPRAAVAADVVAAALLLVAAGVILFGATPRFYLFGLRSSIRTPARPVLAALIILLIRHRRVPEHPLLARIAQHMRSPSLDEERLFEFSRSRGWLEWLLVTLGYAAVVVIGTWPQVRDLTAVPDLGDPLFSMWRLGWIAHALARAPGHLFDTNAFYPEHLTLTYSDSILVPGFVSAPFFWLGFSPLAIYTVVFLGGFATAGIATYYLVRALTGRRDAAAVAGTIAALYPFRFQHYSHLELQMTMFMPLAAWALHRTLARGRWRDGLLTGAAFAGQMLSSLYFGLFFAVYLVPLAAVLWFARHRPLRPLGPLAAGVALAGLLIAPVAAEYIANRPMLGERLDTTVESYSAMAADYLTPHSRSALYGRWSIGALPERELFPGLVAVALTVVALWPPFGAARLGYALALAVAFDCSLGLNGLLYPILHDHVSAFRGLRVPARFAMLVGFSLAVLSGYGAARILSRWSRWRVPLTGVLLLLVVVDCRANVQLTHAWQQPPDIYASIPQPAGTPPPVIAEFPIGTDAQGILFDCRYVYFSVFHWLRTVNGNSGFFPPSWNELQDREQTFPSEESIAYLRSRGVQYVIVHGAFYADPRLFDAATIELAHESGVSFVKSVPFDGSESRLYRVLPEPRAGG